MNKKIRFDRALPPQEESSEALDQWAADKLDPEVIAGEVWSTHRKKESVLLHRGLWTLENKDDPVLKFSLRGTVWTVDGPNATQTCEGMRVEVADFRASDDASCVFEIECAETDHEYTMDRICEFWSTSVLKVSRKKQVTYARTQPEDKKGKDYAEELTTSDALLSIYTKAKDLKDDYLSMACLARARHHCISEWITPSELHTGLKKIYESPEIYNEPQEPFRRMLLSAAVRNSVAISNATEDAKFQELCNSSTEFARDYNKALLYYHVVYMEELKRRGIRRRKITKRQGPNDVDRGSTTEEMTTGKKSGVIRDVALDRKKNPLGTRLHTGSQYRAGFCWERLVDYGLIVELGLESKMLPIDIHGWDVPRQKPVRF